MDKITKENNKAILTIQQKDTTMQWSELYLMFVDALKGLGYVPNRLNELYDEIITEQINDIENLNDKEI